MRSTIEKLKSELKVAQYALAKAEADCLLQKSVQMEDTSRKIEQAYHEWVSALDVVEDPIFIHDKEFRILRCNRAYQRLSGLKFKQIIGRPYYDIFPKTQLPLHQCLQILEQTITEKTEEDVQVGDILFRSRAYIAKDEQGDYLYSTHIFEDITQRKQAEKRLQDEQKFSETLIQSLPNIFFLLDSNGNLLRWNKKLEVLLGLPPQEVMGTNALAFIHEDDRFHISQKIQEVFENGSASAEARMLFINGPCTYTLSGNRIETLLGVNIIGIGIDISDRKQSEEKLRRADRALKTLSAGNLALVRAQSEDALLKDVTNVIVKSGGYRLATVCYAQDDPKKSIMPMAWSGAEDSYFWMGNPSWGDNEQGQIPVARAIRSATTQILRDVASETAFEPWKDAVLSCGYVSSIVLPLSNKGKTFGALSIYSSEMETFDEEEVSLLEELSKDLSYGITNLRTRIANEQQEITLRKGLEQSIQTIVATVEMRDPYTAGHQRRVGELATAIAREIQLDEDQIQGIRFAAIIHDLGKIHIPAEILAKPGRLTEIELMLIKTHPQAGYDILKDIKFPWPIADIILQHHEKLDGSGYPQGLKGDQILFQSKIITVADVVEAMSSHRPYRSALGIEKALNEIKRGRGSEYDSSTVDACLKLFAEKRFAFSRASV